MIWMNTFDIGFGMKERCVPHLEAPTIHLEADQFGHSLNKESKAGIKGSPSLCSSLCSLIHFSCFLLLGNQVRLQPQDMSCNTQCRPCQPCGPTPLANSCNEPCVRQCQNSTVVIEPPAVVVTLPGPILSSFPQNTVVGSSTSAAVGNILSCEGVPINSGGFDLSCITRRYGGNRCRPC
ncbi:feather keratin Cos1-1/Cos1-3/Cos2-1-like [Pyrgilauda ruficollis]|uniref:feather keratin Cos1-1/Cos1-3/Cos2-1-like n=1 Tax=Pyrgilauda ruficollis TaxID=221976 RepID=UPI001B8681A0|nr:feather keratin Cos1-1/Cos1-3/Cos2-1-like [Pyrgilauda ruficollis]